MLAELVALGEKYNDFGEALSNAGFTILQVYFLQSSSSSSSSCK
jgi:hypothetical protein